MDKPRLLDLFCGAGGAAMGYHRAGFEVVGVDIKPQPHYPFEFIQGDALEILDHGPALGRMPRLPEQFDVIHASPPCQKFSQMQRVNTRSSIEHPDLLAPTRERLVALGVPFVIENVVGAPMDKTITLCGSMFGLRVRRHRHFESNVAMLRPSCQHDPRVRLIAVYGDHPEKSPIHRRSGMKGRHDGAPEVTWRASTIDEAREAMRIDWMPWSSITQAIPPAYTEFIGAQLMNALRVVA